MQGYKLSIIQYEKKIWLNINIKSILSNENTSMVYCKIVIHLFFNGPAIPFNSVPYPIINFSKQSVTTFHFIEHPRNNIFAFVLVKESASVKYKVA